jgi:hypothetical protein
MTVQFEQAEIDRITAIATETCDALIERVQAEFPDKDSEALTLILGTLLAFSFLPDADDAEHQHDCAMIINEVLARWSPPILWRLSPITPDL